MMKIKIIVQNKETFQLKKKYLDILALNIIVKIPPNIAKFKKAGQLFSQKKHSDKY